MLAIVNCSIGNIGSLKNAFSYLGASAEVVSNAKELSHYDAAVLPGVGAFDAAMNSLNPSGFSSAIKDFVQTGKPILGICLGMHIFGIGSEEGSCQGLGLLNHKTLALEKLGCKGKIPHVGFNSIHRVEGSSPFLTTMLSRDFYFVHSYAIQATSNMPSTFSAAYVEYEGAEFIAALHYGNLYSTQFHPEKSGEQGLALLQQFIQCSRNV